MADRKEHRFKAVTVVRTDNLLCKSYELEIVDGVVVSAVQLTRAEDMPAIAIGHAQRSLWEQYRHNRDLSASSLRDPDEAAAGQLA